MITIIPKIKSDYVKNVDLMSIEEYKRWKHMISLKDNWWWVRSAGRYQYYAAVVRSDGSVNNYGGNVDYSCGGVVPALYLKSENLIIGYKYYIVSNGEKIRCTAVDNNVLVTDNIICIHRFDRGLNDYETSEIKQWLNGWKMSIE